MTGSGIGGFLAPWTYLNIKSKTGRNKLRVGSASENELWNPFKRMNVGSAGVCRFVYDTYTKISPDFETVPWAAESWRIKDNKTVDITLRAGMKFHDGKPVTAEDVKFTWDYAKTGYLIQSNGLKY